MDSCFVRFAAFFLLIAVAACAPAGPQEPCEDVRSSSLALNQVAKRVSEEAQNGYEVENIISRPAWMEATDMCDPKSLKQTSVPCIVKMLDVLTSYNSAVESLSGFENCSKFVSKVKPAMQKLHRDMSKCVISRTGTVPKKPISDEEMEPILRWEQDHVCSHVLERLFSFSILTARVFAVGDPANHTGGSAHTCM